MNRFQISLLKGLWDDGQRLERCGRHADTARSWETSHLDLEIQRKNSEQTVGVNC